MCERDEGRVTGKLRKSLKLRSSGCVVGGGRGGGIVGWVTYDGVCREPSRAERT